MKYWPLTAVLLAFWLGRETGAEKSATEVSKFDVVRCNSIIVGDKARSTTISPGAVACKDGVLSSKLGPGQVFAESPGFRAALKAEGGSAHVEATATGTGFHAVIGAENKGAVLGLTCAVHEGGKLRPGPSIGSEISRDGARLMVSETGGRDRVVIGSRVQTKETTGEKTRLPAWGITLHDAEGNVIAQLPKQE